MPRNNKSTALREYQRNWRSANSEKCAAYTKRYRAKDPEKHINNQKRWLKENSEKVLNYHRAWRAHNRDKVNAASKKWRVSNPEKQKAAAAKWLKENILYVRKKDRKRSASDPRYRIGKRLRARLWWAIVEQSAKKAVCTLELTGCTIEFLMGHLEAQFRDGMEWNNYGKVWEVDHIRPCVAFNLLLETEQRACFNYSNLQPLFVTENRKKHCKLQFNIHD